VVHVALGCLHIHNRGPDPVVSPSLEPADAIARALWGIRSKNRGSPYAGFICWAHTEWALLKAAFAEPNNSTLRTIGCEPSESEKSRAFALRRTCPFSTDQGWTKSHNLTDGPSLAACMIMGHTPYMALSGGLPLTLGKPLWAFEDPLASRHMYWLG